MYQKASIVWDDGFVGIDLLILIRVNFKVLPSINYNQTGRERYRPGVNSGQNWFFYNMKGFLEKPRLIKSQVIWF